MYSNLKEVLAETFRQWGKDRVPALAAALAFYAMLSLAPLVLVAISVAGALYGEEAATNRLYFEIAQVAGPGPAEAIRTLLEGASRESSSAFPAVIGVVIVVLGASIVFLQLKAAMNVIWDVRSRQESQPSGGFWGAVWRGLKTRLFGIVLVLIAGAALIASLLVSSVVVAIMPHLDSVTTLQLVATRIGDAVLSLVLLTAVFALVFKVVPDVKVNWRDVWVGALVASVLFNIGKYAISFYLGKSAVVSAYGAAGSLVVILLWVYYSCQIVFFGAELTQVISDRYHVRAAKKAAKAEVA